MRNLLSEMLYALTSAYSRKDYDNCQQGRPIETSIGKLFSVLSWGLDSIQEQAELIKLWDDIDFASGSVLDRYGANFGVKRFGEDDTYYRLAIKIKLISQLSGGDIDTVLRAAASLFGIPVENIKLTEIFPAKVGIDVREADLTPETLSVVAEIAQMLKRILAAGIELTATLLNYREFKRDELIGSALFERSSVVFSLPDARHALSQGTPFASAAFERTQLRLEPFTSDGRAFRQTNLTASTVFEHVRVVVKAIQ